MKRAHRSAMLGFMALVAGVSAAERTEEAEILRHRHLIDRIVESAPMFRGICAEQLQEGVRLGWWSAEEKREGDEVLRAIFDGTVEPGPIVAARWEEPRRSPHPVSPLERWSGLNRQMARERDSAPATAVLFDWLEQRVRALETLRTQASSEVARLSLAAAERAWLSARNEGELRPTVVLLQRAQSDSYMAHSQQWRVAVTDPEMQRRSSMSESFRQHAGDPEVALLIEYWCLLGPDQPLLLPAADADVASYARFCLVADLLRNQVPTVLRRPAVVARLDELQARFREEVLAIERSLDEAILQDLPAGECERRLARLALFDPVGLPPLERPRRPASPSDFPVGFSARSIDYRDVVLPLLEKIAQSEHEAGHVAPSRRRKSSGQILRLPEVRGEYAAWHALRLAEESGSAADQATAAERLHGALRLFRPVVAAHVEQRLTRAAAASVSPKAWTAPVAASAGADPVAALLAALDSLSLREKHPEIEPLAEAWRALRQPGAAPSFDAGPGLAQRWAEVFSMPGHIPLAELRERAALALLDPGGGAKPPLEALLRARLEAGMRRGDLEEAARVVAIAHAGDALPLAERTAYSAEIAALRQIPSGDADRDRAVLRQLIQNAAGRPVGEIAAERLKRMR